MAFSEWRLGSKGALAQLGGAGGSECGFFSCGGTGKGSRIFSEIFFFLANSDARFGMFLSLPSVAFAGGAVAATAAGVPTATVVPRATAYRRATSSAASRFAPTSYRVTLKRLKVRDDSL